MSILGGSRRMVDLFDGRTVRKGVRLAAHSGDCINVELIYTFIFTYDVQRLVALQDGKENLGERLVSSDLELR